MSGNTHLNQKLNGNRISLSSNNNKHHLNDDQSQVQKIQEQLTSLPNSSTNPSYSQLKTVATIHHQNISNNHHKLLLHQNTNASQIDRNQQQHRTIVSGGIGSQQTVIPPRYQPPPQPPGGILKHLPLGISRYYPADLTVPHLNLKYPPDIPKLSSVYIPDSEKLQHSNPSRVSQRQSLHRHPNQDENHIRSQTEMLKFVRKSDQDQNESNIPVNGNSGQLTAEQNRHLQSLILELRALKESNQRLSDENQELRDLCCFLDDDRQKGRKLAREWQRFGRYTASVMRQEVSAYQNKLRQLDDKQQELIRDNLELKELCLYLDEERAHIAAINLCSNCCSTVRPMLRDDGDGSSYSTNADDTISVMRNYDRQLPDLNLRSTLSDQTLQYVRSLEQRVQQLEEERLSGTDNVEPGLSDPISSRPEAVIRALQVLEVREQLERDKLCNMTESQIEQMDEGEKALVREMCNVVWRKLEESPNGPNMDS